jgi:hypothetical protein
LPRDSVRRTRLPDDLFDFVDPVVVDGEHRSRALL